MGRDAEGYAPPRLNPTPGNSPTSNPHQEPEHQIWDYPPVNPIPRGEGRGGGGSYHRRRLLTPGGNGGGLGSVRFGSALGLGPASLLGPGSAPLPAAVPPRPGTAQLPSLIPVPDPGPDSRIPPLPLARATPASRDGGGVGVCGATRRSRCSDWQSTTAARKGQKEAARSQRPRYSCGEGRGRRRKGRHAAGP